MSSFFNIATKLLMQAFLTRASEAVADSARTTAEKVLVKANEHVPFNEGALLASSFVDAKGGVAHVGYDVPHAVPMHEHPEYNFQGAGEGKWLERVLDADHDAVLHSMADGVRKAF